MEKIYSPSTASSTTTPSMMPSWCGKLVRKISCFGHADGYEKLLSVSESDEKASPKGKKSAIMSWMRDFMHPHQAARAEKLRTAKLKHTRGILDIDPMNWSLFRTRICCVLPL
jgi:hypothetical protein